jgi:hypothetical protein
MNTMKNKVSGKSTSVEEFDYEFLWSLMDKSNQDKHHIRLDERFDDEPMEHPLSGPQPEPRSNQDRLVLDMDDDEYQAYGEFIASCIEASEFAPLIGINEKEYVLKLIIKKDSQGNREIEVKEVGFKNKARHASWYPKPDMEEVNGVVVDVSAFNTHDFQKNAPVFDMGRYKMEKMQQHLKDLLLEFSTIANMSRATYDNLKRRILGVHDEIKELRERRLERFG